MATDSLVFSSLVATLQQHAQGGRWVGPGRADNDRRVGRPRGSGQFRTRLEALWALREAYQKVASELAGCRRPGVTDVARQMRTARGTIHWWFKRFGISMADLI